MNQKLRAGNQRHVRNCASRVVAYLKLSVTAHRQLALMGNCANCSSATVVHRKLHSKSVRIGDCSGETDDNANACATNPSRTESIHARSMKMLKPPAHPLPRASILEEHRARTMITSVLPFASETASMPVFESYMSIRKT